MEQQQQPQPQQPVTFVPQQPYPYPAVQPMMMATPQQMPGCHSIYGGSAWSTCTTSRNAITRTNGLSKINLYNYNNYSY